ncbi:alpha/beta fold hydrolase [Candidatus Woesearchaeota archaeon]|nr:alpha/beta fold hydrolase [Candidatus Woesearchaeota archaeon]
MKKLSLKQKIIILIPALFILISIVTIIGTNLSFLLSQELHVKISPQQKVIQVQNNETFDVNYKISTNKFWFCDATCTFTVYDTKNNKYILNETQNSKDLKNKNITLNLDTKGIGEQIFYVKLNCKSTKTFLCPTDEKEYKKTALLTVDYTLNTKEQEIINQTKDNLQEYIRISTQLNSLDKYFAQISNIMTLSYDPKTIEKINSTKKLLINLWIQNEYTTLNDRLNNQTMTQLSDVLNKAQKEYNTIIRKYNEYNKTIQILTNISNNFNKLNDSFNFYSKINNSIKISNILNNIEKLKQLKSTINTPNLIELTLIDESIKNILNQTQNSISVYNSQIQNEINQKIAELSNYNITINKTTQCNTLKEISKQTASLNEANKTINDTEITNFLNYCLAKNVSLNNTITIPKVVILPQIEYQTIQTIQDNKPQCCINNNCTNCEITSKTPIIFIHGHSFSKDSPIEESLTSFVSFQEYFESKGYVNAGDYLELEDSNQIWSKMAYPISISASYYSIIDTNMFVVRKTESIENYAIRLKEIIENIKEHTKSDKVTIVAHSMGGLVTRYYIELFGNNSIDKLIEIGTPNYGVEGKVESLCSTMGSEKECQDMTKNSVFLTRLNSKQTKIPLYIIYGTGCDTDKIDGDGIVTKENVLLNYAIETKEIQGNCSFGKYLHNKMLNDVTVQETVLNWLSN